MTYTKAQYETAKIIVEQYEQEQYAERMIEAEQAINIFDDDEPYCHDCGEDQNLAYNDQYANGESWTCRNCENSFMFQRNEQ